MAARRYLWCLDLLLFLALCAVSVPVTLRFTHGDLWLDEADYAIAGLHSVSDNRWDTSNKPDQPDLLVRLRHYHAPATALILRLAHRFGSNEETLRIPFVVAGALSVGVVYLCGLALFGKRREIAVACALLVVVTPANIRMSSHAIPWSFIILELLCLLLAVLGFARLRRPSSLLWMGVVMGLLFVTSETFFVAAAILAVVMPLVLLPEICNLAGRRKKREATEGSSAESPGSSGLITGNSLAGGLTGGVAAFVAVAIIVWPVGLRGHCIMMLRHYIDMRTSGAFPVNIGSRVYQTAPKWAYLYWYSQNYRPFFLCYFVGILAVAAIALFRVRDLTRAAPNHANKADIDNWHGPGAAVLLVFTLVLLAAAHRAHIIGAEYLAHCLPFMTLCAGYAVLLISARFRAVGVATLVGAGVVFLRWSPSHILPGMDSRTQVARWQQAATIISPRWKPLDRVLLGPQSSNVAYWYLHEWAHIPLHDWQIGQFSLLGPGPNFLHNLEIGKYRWVAISSQFEDNIINAVDQRSMKVLKKWEVALKSDEHGQGTPRLTLFRCPISAFDASVPR